MYMYVLCGVIVVSMPKKRCMEYCFSLVCVCVSDKG